MLESLLTKKIAELGSWGLADSCVGEDEVSEGAERSGTDARDVADRRQEVWAAVDSDGKKEAVLCVRCDGATCRVALKP